MTEAFVRQWAAAWGTADPDAIARLAHPDIRVHWPGLTGPITGAAAWQARVAGLTARLPGLSLEITDHAVGPGTTFISWRAHATVGGHPAQWEGIDRMRLRDGRVAEALVVFDTAPFNR